MKSITIDAVAATAMPLDLELVKNDLRITEDDLDAVLTGQYIPAAMAWAEGATRRSMIARVHTWIFDKFPSGTTIYATPWSSIIYMPRGIVQSIASIKYSSDGSIVTLTGPSSGSPAGTDYQEDLTGHVARVMPTRGESWPEVDSDVPQPVKITFTAGWASDKLVPADLRRAMTAYIYGEMEADGLLQIRPGFDFDFADKLISGYRSTEA